MADLLYVYDVTCAASVVSTTPTEVVTVPAGPYYVDKVRIIIPDGHSGLTGIALGFGHQPVIPFNPGAFISGNDERYDYDLGDYPPGVAWSVFLCNSDLQSHSWETRWQLNLMTPNQAATVSQPLAPADIYAQAGLTTGNGS